MALSSSRAPPTSAWAMGSAAPQPEPGARRRWAPRRGRRRGPRRGGGPRARARRQSARWLASEAEAQASIRVPVRSSSVGGAAERGGEAVVGQEAEVHVEQAVPGAVDLGLERRDLALEARLPRELRGAP